MAAEGAMAGRGERRRCAALVLALISIALLAFHLLTGVALAASFPESVAPVSLGTDVRDVHGRPIPPAPGTPP